MANAEKSTCQSVHARGILVTSKLTTRGPVDGAQSKLPTVISKAGSSGDQ